MAEDCHRVVLNVYDRLHWLARRLPTEVQELASEAIWHIGVVVYGKEYYYYEGGIQAAPAGSTPYGRPLRVVDLGVTYSTQHLFEEYLQGINPRYNPETYSIVTHNCHNFSNEVAQFLVGTGIPDYTLQLPNEALSSPMGTMISADVLLLRNKKVSACVLVCARLIRWKIFELLDCDFLTIVSFTLILGMLGQFMWSNASGYLNRGSPSQAPRIVLPAELFVNIAISVGKEVNRVLGCLQDISCGGNAKQLVMVIISLLAAPTVRTWCNFLTGRDRLCCCSYVARSLWEVGRSL